MPIRLPRVIAVPIAYPNAAPLALKKLKVPSRYSDGNKLYLKIEDTGSRRWILRLSLNGKKRDIDLRVASF